MHILLSPRRPPVNIELPDGTVFREVEIAPGQAVRVLGEESDVVLVRILVEGTAGPDFLPQADRELFAFAIRSARVIVVYQPSRIVAAENIAAETLELLDLSAKSIIVVVECSAEAGQAWLAFAIRAMQPGARTIPVHDVPPGYGLPLRVLH